MTRPDRQPAVALVIQSSCAPGRGIEVWLSQIIQDHSGRERHHEPDPSTEEAA
jgi:hypothetical protein